MLTLFPPEPEYHFMFQPAADSLTREVAEQALKRGTTLCVLVDSDERLERFAGGLRTKYDPDKLLYDYASLDMPGEALLAARRMKATYGIGAIASASVSLLIERPHCALTGTGATAALGYEMQMKKRLLNTSIAIADGRQAGDDRATLAVTTRFTRYAKGEARKGRRLMKPSLHGWLGQLAAIDRQFSTIDYQILS